MGNTRIFFATDVHGSETCFLKFVNAGKFYKANVTILGGDLTGKAVIPIVKRSDGAFEATFLDTKQVLGTKDEVAAFEQKLRFTGYYPYLADPREMDELSADEVRVSELFSKLMVESTSRWMQLAEQRLKGSDVRCFISPGNDDRFCIDPVLDGSDCICNPEGKVVKIDADHEMITSGFTNPTPWKTARECAETELAEKIESMSSQVENMSKCIFNLHCPPFNSRIDAAPELDAELRPKRESLGLYPVGSTAVRAAIETHQPLMGLHGHIHESGGEVKIGRTSCLNPGSEYGEGVLRGVLLNLDEKGIRNYVFVRG